MLAPQESLFIEACCLPEMRFLGYDTELKEESIIDVLDAFQDDAPLERQELADYVWGGERSRRGNPTINLHS